MIDQQVGVTFEFTGLKEALDALDALPRRIGEEALLRGLDDFTRAVTARARRSFNMSGFPRRDSGNLARSLTEVPARAVGDGWEASVGVLATAPYGRILEKGGMQPAREIRPRVARALAWQTGMGGFAQIAARGRGMQSLSAFRHAAAVRPGDLAFATVVRQPARYQRAIPYLMPSMLAEADAGLERIKERLGAVLDQPKE